MYTAEINNGNLILTSAFNKPGLKARGKTIDLTGNDVGLIEETFRGEEFRVFTKGSDHDAFVFGPVSAADVAAQTPALREIPAISCMIPGDILLGDKDKGEPPFNFEAANKFVHNTLTTYAVTGEGEDGYSIRAFVNPDAIDVIEDKGTYREIHLKKEFGKVASFHTALNEPQINTALGKTPAPVP